MKRKGLIYKAEDQILHKVYIGQTQQKLEMRIKDHIQTSKNKNNPRMYYNVFYKAIRFIGEENFKWEILEDNIPGKDLDAKEVKYIRLYNSFEDGWNSSPGGNRSYNSKISEITVNRIKKELKTSKGPIKSIAKKYNVSPYIVSDINCGETWYDPDIKYPICTSLSVAKNFSDSEIDEIIRLLKNGESYKNIASKFNCCRRTIKGICTGESISYKREDEKYPIRPKMFNHLSQDIIYKIVNDIKTTEMSSVEIATKYNIERKTVSNINNGTYHKKDILSKFPDIIFPIRKFDNLKKLRKVYSKL